MGVYRYKQKQGDARSFAQRRRAADKKGERERPEKPLVFLAHDQQLRAAN